MDPKKFANDIRLLRSLDFSSVDPETAAHFLKACTPAFGELVRTANSFMNWVSANQEIFVVEEILAPTRPALEAAIFVSNCGRAYDFSFAQAGHSETEMLKRVVLPMQAAAVMAPTLSARTKESLAVINEALQQVNAKRAEEATRLSGAISDPDPASLKKMEETGESL